MITAGCSGGEDQLSVDWAYAAIPHLTVSLTSVAASVTVDRQLAFTNTQVRDHKAWDAHRTREIHKIRAGFSFLQIDENKENLRESI